jgi:hypothetical protein
MTAPIRRARIDHLEVTVAAGTLTALMPDLAAFYGDALGFGQVEPRLKDGSLLTRTVLASCRSYIKG